ILSHLVIASVVQGHLSQHDGSMKGEGAAELWRKLNCLAGRPQTLCEAFDGAFRGLRGKWPSGRLHECKTRFSGCPRRARIIWRPSPFYALCENLSHRRNFGKRPREDANGIEGVSLFENACAGKETVGRLQAIDTAERGGPDD